MNSNCSYSPETLNLPWVNSNWSYSPATLNSGQHLWFFCPVWPWNLMDDLEKTIGNLFYTMSSFVHRFKAISEFKLELVWKRPIWVIIHDFLSHVTLKYDGWPWKTIGHLFCATSKLCASFRSNWWIQTGVKRIIWIKIHNFFCRVTLKFEGWPCITIGHLSKATSSFVHHFIITCEFKLELWFGNS